MTTTWWRKDRDPEKLFVDYNQNARDHTIASAYSVRGVPEATVSTPIAGTRLPTSSRASSRSRPCPTASPGSATCTGGIDDDAYPLDELLEWADRDGLE